MEDSFPNCYMPCVACRLKHYRCCLLLWFSAAHAVEAAQSHLKLQVLFLQHGLQACILGDQRIDAA
jgi:hypothetical protein